VISPRFPIGVLTMYNVPSTFTAKLERANDTKAEQLPGLRWITE